MLLLLPVTHARVQRVAAARSPSCRHIVRPTAIRLVNVRVSNPPDPAPSVRPRAPDSEDVRRSWFRRVDVHWQLWPVSMRHGPGVRYPLCLRWSPYGMERQSCFVVSVVILKCWTNQICCWELDISWLGLFDSLVSRKLLLS